MDSFFALLISIQLYGENTGIYRTKQDLLKMKQ